MDEKEEDEYIFYGTPLPEIEDEITLRKKAARELEVRDEKGRRRFHGAFSGGFSAGYFNTVGSKEGWAPSSFVSSRNKTADRIQQNPEDFMDEEDLGEFGIATRKIHTSYKFEDSASLETKKRKYNELDSVIPGEAPLKEIVRPVRDSIGIEILKKLGWKPGQGIGPRVKKADLKEKVYGCSLPDSALIEEDDPYALSFTFAPKDTVFTTYKTKDNRFGLDYIGLSKQNVLSAKTDKDNPTFTKSFLKKDKRKLAISGQAFGVGAFEDDDDDIYSKDDMSQYDFSDLDKDSDQTAKQHGKRSIEKQKSDVIEGFRLATETSLKMKYYPPPELPRDFIPMFSKLSTEKTQPSSSQCSTSEERAILLGEKKFQPFQLKTFSPAASESKHEKEMKSLSDKFSPSKATFKPFPNDSAKQKRYEEFLKLKDSGELHKLILPSTMTEWEKQQELEEFNRSSVLFKPLSNALSSKFESRSHLSVEHEVIDAIEKAKKERNQKVSSKKKLIGLKNRKTFDWFPCSLLCKRFNVPNPYPDSTPSGTSTQQSKSIFEHLTFSSTSENTDEKITPLSNVPAKSEKTAIVGDPLKSTVRKDDQNTSFENVEKPEDSKFPYENEKPPMDFFKDIFENSSSSEEEEAYEPVQQTNPSDEQNKLSVVDDVKVHSSKNISENTSKMAAITKKSGFGVFANLDLDALNQRRIPENKIEPKEQQNKNIVPQQTKSNINQTKEILLQTELLEKPELPERSELPEGPGLPEGPELPPNYSENLQKTEQYPSKRHKVKHKHKHHKHKSKKKKKKSSHKSSNENSSDSESDISPLLIIEKLKKIQKKL